MTIAKQIEAELQSFASRGERPAYKLTLTSMAGHFNASVQPVRTAVGSLLKGNWLLRGAGRQLVINPAKKGAEVTVKALTAGSQKDAEAELTGRVLGHSLRGESVFLREEETAEQLGFGRTVIRTILGRMAGRGLVEHVPRRGWRVCPFSRSQMNEYLEMRELLEMRAMDLSFERLEKKELERLLERNSPTKNDRLRIDNSLHRYWVDMSGNRYMSEFFDRHGQYYTMLFDYATMEKSVLAEMAEQHCEMLRSLLKGNLKAAQKTLHHHIQLQHPNVSYLMERRLAQAG
ncbi:MAG TPA: GntR family transcriptional regulator [Opitutales bacterium]|nr:GntR family transcriptional regulator [Opitutales bacterium]